MAENRIDNRNTLWEDRLRKSSHTGWSDPLIYAYDQEERLSLIGRHLDALQFDRKTALDFGCGTGDFSAMLLKKGFTVWAADPYVTPRLHTEKFTFSPRVEDLFIPENSLSLILSVTVLDHILDMTRLRTILGFFRTALHDNGYCVFLEYAVGPQFEKPGENRYQAFRTLEEWNNILETNGFHIDDISAAPHPVRCPSRGYMHYRKNHFIQWISHLTSRGYAGKALLPLLQHYTRKVVRAFPADAKDIQGSPLKIITASLSKKHGA